MKEAFGARDALGLICIATGVQMGRNTIVVASADVVIAVGGGSGTLSEMALAWQLGKPIVAFTAVEGWSANLASKLLDHRSQEPVHGAKDVASALAMVTSLLERPRRDHRGIGSGWRGDAP